MMPLGAKACLHVEHGHITSVILGVPRVVTFASLQGKGILGALLSIQLCMACQGMCDALASQYDQQHWTACCA